MASVQCTSRVLLHSPRHVTGGECSFLRDFTESGLLLSSLFSSSFLLPCLGCRQQATSFALPRAPFEEWVPPWCHVFSGFLPSRARSSAGASTRPSCHSAGRRLAWPACWRGLLSSPLLCLLSCMRWKGAEQPLWVNFRMWTHKFQVAPELTFTLNSVCLRLFVETALAVDESWGKNLQGSLPLPGPILMGHPHVRLPISAQPAVGTL